MIESNQKVVEAYYENSRSLIEVLDIPSDFVPEPLVIDGDELKREVRNLGADIGAVGDKLSESGLVDILEIPVKDGSDGEYDYVKAGLNATILSDKQVHDLGIAEESGLRVGVIKSELSKKFVFFRVPENDVCEFFSTQIVDQNRARVVENVKQNKVDLDRNGDKYIDIGRKIYGLWNDAVLRGDLSDLDEVMKEVYGAENMTSTELGGVLAVLQVGLSQEADRPADNWWLALSAVRKTLEILDKDGYSYKPEAISEVRKIVIEIAYKCFYPEMLYKFVVEALSKINYAGGEELLENHEMSEIKDRLSPFLAQKKTAV